MRPPRRPQSARRGGEYVVVARRYRPQTFDELIGQEHVAQALSNAIATNRVGHAYLFTGARGVGKTSAARILAKALNCEHGPDARRPATSATSARASAPASDVDVLEIDGASNRGIDEIRQLRQNVNVRPSRLAVQDLHHRRSPHAHARGLQRLAEDAGRAARAREVHLLHDRADEDPDHDPLALPAVRFRRHPDAVDRRAAAADRRRPKGSRPSRRPWTSWPAGPPARCATASRCWSNCWPSRRSEITVADVHGMLGTAGEERLAALVGHLVERNAAGGAGRSGRRAGRRRRRRPTARATLRLLPRLHGRRRRLPGRDVPVHLARRARATGRRPASSWGWKRSWRSCRSSTRRLSRLRYSTQGRMLAELALVRICHLEDLDELGRLDRAVAAASRRSGGRRQPSPATRRQPPLARPRQKKS